MKKVQLMKERFLCCSATLIVLSGHASSTAPPDFEVVSGVMVPSNAPVMIEALDTISHMVFTQCI